jgi:hypothetical protein
VTLTTTPFQKSSHHIDLDKCLGLGIAGVVESHCPRTLIHLSLATRRPTMDPAIRIPDYARVTVAPTEPLDTTRFASREAAEDHLLDSCLPAIYTDMPTHLSAAPTYQLADATRWLRFLAEHLNRRGGRDFLWWRLLAAGLVAIGAPDLLRAVTPRRLPGDDRNVGLVLIAFGTIIGTTGELRGDRPTARHDRTGWTTPRSPRRRLLRRTSASPEN